MLATHTRRDAIFWILGGLLLTVVARIDIKIEFVKITPECVGYMIATCGFFQLRNSGRAFQIAFGAALFAAALALVYDLTILSGSDPLSQLRLLVNVTQVVLVWFLLSGIAELAEAGQHQRLAGAARRRRVYFLLAVILNWILPRLSLGYAWYLVGLLGLVVFTVAFLSVLLLLLRSARELADDRVSF